MVDKKIQLNQCPYNLEDMDVSEKKIHCSSCSKNLVDFRGKTPDQIKEELKTFTQTPCGVFSKNQVETKSYIIPRFAFKKKYVAAVFLAVGLFPTWAKAQIEPKVDSTISITYTTDSLSQFGTLTGTITDDLGDPLPGSSVIIKKGEKAVYGGVTDIDGNYKITGMEEGIYTVEVSFVGMKVKTLPSIRLTNNVITQLNVSLEEGGGPLIIDIGNFCGLISVPHSTEIMKRDWSGKSYSREEIRQIW
jgi:hypothetical protein